MKKAIVIGAGISGIAAASRLVECGFETQILESEALLGGRIGTRPHGDIEIDLGGRNFTANDARLHRLLAKFGVSESTDYRFNSVSIGVARPFDMRTDGDLFTRGVRFLRNATSAGPLDLLRVQGVVSKARAASASVVGSAYWTQLAEETGDPTAGSYFGHTVANQVLRPWTLRMMASEPDEVYLGNLGPLLGRQPGPLKRVQGGMGVFLRAVREKLAVRSGHRVHAVELGGDRVTGVTGTTAAGAQFHERADVVVVTAPAPNAADMLESAPGVAAVLRQVIYRPVATIVAEYADIRFPSDASGLFLPRGHAVSHIAKYDDSHRMRFSFAGVAARRAFADASVSDLLKIGEATFEHFGGRLGARASFTGNIWYPGLCAQTWMHHRTLAALREHEKRVVGLVLTGDYFRGNSLEACATAAEENVDRFVDEQSGRQRRAGTRASALESARVEDAAS